MESPLQQSSMGAGEGEVEREGEGGSSCRSRAMIQ